MTHQNAPEHVLNINHHVSRKGTVPSLTRDLRVAGADLGGVCVTSHPPPGAAAYFMLLLCVKAIYTFLIMPTS